MPVLIVHTILCFHIHVRSKVNQVALDSLRKRPWPIAECYGCFDDELFPLSHPLTRPNLTFSHLRLDWMGSIYFFSALWHPRPPHIVHIHFHIPEAYINYLALCRKGGWLPHPSSPTHSFLNYHRPKGGSKCTESFPGNDEHKWMDGRMEGWTKEWMDGWVHDEQSKSSIGFIRPH